uniref:Uncharacterized protein n=1 Tax=Synarthrophyton chejuense TaxID=2485825 RepID=A0A3G3MIG9_9FLOR|nr:hypothetical protein [Synarthrophyton chejuense]AYR06631.1 hypothetical protein [Synarthrophyton chejuense]
MNFSLNSRLHIYHKLISKYDFVDKKFLISNLFNSDLRILKIFSSDNSIELLIQKELSTFKKFNLLCNIKNSFFNNFLVTLRDSCIKTYLEFLLYTNFKYNVFKKSKNYLFFVIKNEFISFYRKVFSFTTKNTFLNLNLFINLSKLYFSDFIRLNYFFIPCPIYLNTDIAT